MKYLLTFALAILLTATSLFAQPIVTYSTETFPESTAGEGVMFLKNGNTVWISLQGWKIHTRVYNNDHKLIVNESAEYKNLFKETDGNSPSLTHTFRSGENIVLLMESKTNCLMGGYVSCVKHLYRVIINSNTGKIILTDKPGQLEKVKGLGYTLGEMVFNDIYVANDPVTDNYAILFFNGYTNDNPDRIRTQIFNPDGKIIKQASLKSHAIDWKNVHFDGFTMHNNNVYIATNQYNPKEKKSFNVPLYISALRDGADTFESKELTNSPFTIQSGCTLAYHPQNNTLYLLSTSIVDKKMKITLAGGNTDVYYDSYLYTIDPNTLSATSFTPLRFDAVNQYAKKAFKNNGFFGIKPEINLNNDATVTMTPREEYSISNNLGGNSFQANYITSLGIAQYDKNSKEIGGYAIKVREHSRAFTYALARESYYSYKYINTGASQYVILNDLVENFDIPEANKPHSITTISDAHCILYTIQDGKISKSYLFGKPENPKEGNFASINTIAKDDNNTVALIKINGKTEQAQVVWIKL